MANSLKLDRHHNPQLLASLENLRSIYDKRGIIGFTAALNQGGPVVRTLDEADYSFQAIADNIGIGDRYRAYSKLPYNCANRRENERNLLETIKGLITSVGVQIISHGELRERNITSKMLSLGITISDLVKWFSIKDQIAALDVRIDYHRPPIERVNWLVDRIGYLPTSVELASTGIIPPSWAGREREIKSNVFQHKYAQSAKVISRSGHLWRSGACANVSNFLWARGIDHLPGNRFDSTFLNDNECQPREPLWDIEILLPTTNLRLRIEDGATRIFEKVRSECLGRKWKVSIPENYLILPSYLSNSDVLLNHTLNERFAISSPWRFETHYDPYFPSTSWQILDELVNDAESLKKAHNLDELPSGKIATAKARAWERRLNRRSTAFCGGKQGLRFLLGESLAVPKEVCLFAAVSDFNVRDYLIERYGLTSMGYIRISNQTPEEDKSNIELVNLILRYERAITLDSETAVATLPRYCMTKLISDLTRKYGVPVKSLAKSSNQLHGKDVATAAAICKSLLVISVGIDTLQAEADLFDVKAQDKGFRVPAICD